MAELMSIISDFNYKRYIQCISPCDTVTPESFQNRSLSQTHWIDSRNSYDGVLINCGFIFDIFGAFSSEDADSVQSGMIKIIQSEHELYTQVGRVVLNMRGCNLDTWLGEMSDVNCLPDELMLYALSRTYNRHTFVMCNDRNWSTLEVRRPMDESSAMQACHVHLVYLGNGTYGELKQKPFNSHALHPSTMEQTNFASMQIGGKGRPRKTPLNLVVNKKKKQQTHQPSTSSDRLEEEYGIIAFTEKPMSNDTVDANII